MIPSRAVRLTSLTLFALLVAPWAPAVARAQSGDTRGLGDLGFVNLRPPSPKTSSPSKRKKPVYKPAPPVASSKPGPRVPTPVAGATEALVGVTLWRLRVAARSDGDAARLLVHEPATNTDGEYTSERVAIDTPLAQGQRVRLSIETPRDGYLYVIDREVYSDGTTSPPVLIFPTQRTRAGDNKVGAGAVVEIPGANDNPIYFTAQRSRPDQVAESLTLIVSPTPLEGVTITKEYQPLPAEQVAAWEQKWGGTAERLELEGGAGTLYTTEEKAAGGDPKTRLDQDDPVPQTVFKTSARPVDPVIVTFPLKLR